MTQAKLYGGLSNSMRTNSFGLNSAQASLPWDIGTAPKSNILLKHLATNFENRQVPRPNLS
jgi:hypothetical protein